MGGIAGAVTGLYTSAVIDEVWENGGGVVDAARAGWDAVADTGRAVGELAEGAWDAIF
ncbi:MAG: hypothetical protein ACT4RN_03165 [Pseudonocardia sp.]